MHIIPEFANNNLFGVLNYNSRSLSIDDDYFQYNNGYLLLCSVRFSIPVDFEIVILVLLAIWPNLTKMT